MIYQYSIDMKQRKIEIEDGYYYREVKDEERVELLTQMVIDLHIKLQKIMDVNNLTDNE
jgi:hypothetical protein